MYESAVRGMQNTLCNATLERLDCKKRSCFLPDVFK